MNSVLEKIIVLDLTHYQAGTTCTKILADLGAEVIKVEPPWGEQGRFVPPLIKGLSPYFVHLNRNKKSITLNLKTEKGVKIFTEMVRQVDVVVENYAPGTMEKLGISYDTLKGVNPQLILVSISGFGQHGPYSRRLSFDPVAQAMSGFMAITGDSIKQDGPPVRVPEAPADTIPGMFGSIGVLAALLYRYLTGRGQRIDVAQLDSMIFSILSHTFYTMTGLTWHRASRGVWGAGRPSGIFKASDGYVNISASMGPITDRLREVVGVENLNRAAVEEWLKDKPVEEVVTILSKQRIPVGPVLTLDKVIADPQVLAREMFVELDHPEIGKVTTPGFPIKFSETGVTVEGGIPQLGQHTEEVLFRFLNYSKEEVAKLREEKVI